MCFGGQLLHRNPWHKSAKLSKMNTADRMEAWLGDIVISQWICRVYGFQTAGCCPLPMKLLNTNTNIRDCLF